uniref:B30.2/SPRY domain-containing protein n=1 Tax=Knipowitschia caucasica TaxID=637954 RepID=A0AAV2M0U3_KNICA
MDDPSLLQLRCLLNLRRGLRDVEARPQEVCTGLRKDGDTLSYQGNSEEVGCYVAGVPLSKENFYFEVTIVDTGVRGTIAVGLVPKFYRVDHQPGWLPHSVAYHADNGKLYNGNPVGQQFGPKCSHGDRIGCGINFDNIKNGIGTVFFTKNGKEMGSVKVGLSADGLFPAVGMHSLGEEVTVHLGAEWSLEDSAMMVDSQEDEWGRLYDVTASGTSLLTFLTPRWSPATFWPFADDTTLIGLISNNDESAYRTGCVLVQW